MAIKCGLLLLLRSEKYDLNFVGDRQFFRNSVCYGVLLTSEISLKIQYRKLYYLPILKG